AVGTWKYMAPERFSNDEVTYRADIYSLACVLHECLTGSPPYRSDSAGTLVTAHLMDPIPRPSASRAGIPKAFDAVVARGMAKKPEDRYASCGDLALAAHEALSTPDRDHAEDILRRSQETTLPGSGPIARQTLPAAPVTPPPRPTPSTPPPASRPQHSPAAYGPSSGSGPGLSGPIGQSGPIGPSGPIPHTPGPIAQRPGPPSTPSWNPPSGPVAAISVAIVLVVGGVAIYNLIPRDTPKPPPKPVGEDRLSSLLLSTSEVNSAMGSSSMTPGKTLTSMDSSSLQFSQADCQGALYNRQAPVYAGTGYTAINALVSSEPGDNYDHFLNQAVVAFPTAEKARAFLNELAPKWKSCESKTVSVTNTSKNKTYRWTFGQVEGTPPKMDLMETQEGADGWECQHSMRATNNIVVDVNACGYRITNQGAQVADMISGKVEKEEE
ncbi:serine/threonine protein kinase, partial [Mycobacterium intermedium]